MYKIIISIFDTIIHTNCIAAPAAYNSVTPYPAIWKFHLEYDKTPDPVRRNS